MGLMRATSSRSAGVRWVARIVVMLASWMLVGGIGVFLFFRFGDR